MLHYAGVGNHPIQRLDAVYVGLHAYNTVGTEILGGNPITNYVATNNDNKADPEINF